MYWKTETIDGKFHMYRGDKPNIFWEEYEPDIDTRDYYETNAIIPSCDGDKYLVLEINEDEI